MFDAERLLGGLIRQGVRRRSPRIVRTLTRPGFGTGTGALVGMGALGLAFAAFEHFSQKKGSSTSTGSVPAAPQTPPPPPPPASSAAEGAAGPPPPPSAASEPVSEAAPLAKAAAPPPPAAAAALSDAAPVEPVASKTEAADAASEAPPPPLPQPEERPVADMQRLSQEEAMLLIRAMIAAAHADGHLDEDERATIMSHLEEAGFGSEEKEFMLREIERPLPLDRLIPWRPRPELAHQVFAASLLAIDVDTAEERSYLDKLADRLGLDAAARRAIESGLGISG